MCLTTFSGDSNPPMNVVQLMVSEVTMFHENTGLRPSGDSYEFYKLNNDPTKNIAPVFFGIPGRNQIVWVELAK